MGRRRLTEDDIAAFVAAARSRDREVSTMVLPAVPMDIDQFITELYKERPLRMRSIHKHLVWLRKQAAMRGIELWQDW